ncbi:MAG: caspase family protein [Hyphomicrobium sp.]
MLLRIVLAFSALFSVVTLAAANDGQKRVALVIGQNKYKGGGHATIGLNPLANPTRDASTLAKVLTDHKIEVLSCDGVKAGCYDLDEKVLNQAVDRFEAAAKGADLALVFYAGHGMQTHQGNLLASIDAKVLDCVSGDVVGGVTVDRLMRATNGARNKLVIIDACRNNPLGEVCKNNPDIASKKLPFALIEPGVRENFLLVTSAQFGALALDGPEGTHSPFLTALLDEVERHPHLYFGQVMDRVAQATKLAVDQLPPDSNGTKHVQAPGGVVGSGAPADCLAGRDCIGDARVAILGRENIELERRSARQRAQARADAAEILTDVQQDSRVLGFGMRRTKEKLDRAEARFNRLLAEAPVDLELTRQRVRLQNLLASTYIGLGETAAADAAAEKSVHIATAAVTGKSEAEPAERRCPKVPTDRLEFLLSIASAYEWRRDTRQHIAHLQAALEDNACQFALLDQLPPSRQRHVDVVRARSFAFRGRAEILAAQGKAAQALADYAESLRLRRQFSIRQPRSRDGRHWVAFGRIEYGDALSGLGRISDALSQFEQARVTWEQLRQIDRGDVWWQWDYARTLERIATVHTARGEVVPAAKLYADSAILMSEIVDRDTSSRSARHNTSIASRHIAVALQQTGDAKGARAKFQEALRDARLLVKHDPRNWRWLDNLVSAHRAYAWFLSGRGFVDHAVLHMELARRAAGRLARLDSSALDWQRTQAVVTSDLGEMTARSTSGDARQRQRQLMREATSLIEKLPRTVGTPANWLWTRAHINRLRLEQTLQENHPNDASGRLTAVHAARSAHLQDRELILALDATNREAVIQVAHAHRLMAEAWIWSAKSTPLRSSACVARRAWSCVVSIATSAATCLRRQTSPRRRR